MSHTLTKFVVGKGSGSSIRELGKLKNLQGTLSISKLQNVVPPKDALNAGLKDKKHLEKLALEWDATTPRSESERIVLESLRPHTSLKSLTIKGYGGGIFPDWPFGGLKVLRFEKMSGWEEWLSSSSAENEGGGFPDLKELCIKDCPKLTGGLPIHIPSLAKLEIDSCPKLVASLLRSQLGAMSEDAEIVLEELPTGRRKLEVNE
ncbi:hypothetical protein CJ030_MR1G019995 [Morella rubra]|uniref:R13L1/DRL21-like LRR repeat region domain-containing protein n=1 Tax=Morella rubra TaxID=262757 RepID=A0A6A1WQG0_9ROSI|nr:hypothetical protein CJ030_MR1G019995 [Morella rubra]